MKDSFKLIIEKHKNQPILADPVPKGYQIITRGMIGRDEHVVFCNKKLKKYRIYVNGRFSCEKSEEPIEIQKLSVDKRN